MKLTGAIILRTLLERQGIRILSGMPGGANLPLYDALHESHIQHVLARHEQGAGFIAQGQARATGRAAVCLATSGPGATNLLTAIADARLDSIPLVAITGQVPQALIGTDAFQEVDTYGLTVPITKHNFLVRSARELLEVIPLAFEIAESGRPGPVVVDVPKDVLQASIEVSSWPVPGKGQPTPPCADAQIDELARQLHAAARPVLYIGGGAANTRAAASLRQLSQREDLPSVCTLMGLGVMNADAPLHMGMLGMHGLKGTNVLLNEADFIFAIGARFDDRATGKLAEFCPSATIAHVDIDPSEIGKNKKAHLALIGDAADVAERLASRMETKRRPEWRDRALELKRQYPLHAPADEPLHPVNVIRALAASLPGDSIVTTDVGQHQMWVAQAYPFSEPRTLQTSGGLGTMGFGLPAAIGAALAAPGRRGLCVSGDGSILMNVQELATLAEWNLPVKTVIFNNANLGLVRQQQQLFYGGRYSASRLDKAPDFAALARAFGIPACRIDRDTEDPLAALREALSGDGPCVVDLQIHETTNVYPMVPPGAANHQTITEPAYA
ncbi:biosynthetic-type acetolactate synthase large subunit [Opitutaceae bacterium EW11]|nr:biosynthetic-type acetolactate synthase large subunit [Opitutaceae bacterium EW11]